MQWNAAQRAAVTTGLSGPALSAELRPVSVLEYASRSKFDTAVEKLTGSARRLRDLALAPGVQHCSPCNQLMLRQAMRSSAARALSGAKAQIK